MEYKTELGVEEERWLEMVIKLIKLTRSGQLQWKQISLEPAQALIVSGYQASYHNVRLRLYTLTILSEFWFVRDNGKVVLKGKSDDSSVEWTAPNVSGLRDLLSVVERKISETEQVEGEKFLEKILTETT